MNSYENKAGKKVLIQDYLIQLKVTPFYQDEDNVYKWADHTLDTSFEHLESICQGDENFYNVSREYCEKFSKEVATKMSDAVEQLKALVVKEEDMQYFIDTKKKQGTLITYANILKDLWIYISEIYLSCRFDENREYTNYNYQLADREKTRTKTTQVILNKNNPFADVSIKNETFLYAGKNGFHQLNFTTGHTLMRKEKEEKELFMLKPTFQITSKKSLDMKNDARIQFDESLAKDITTDDKFYIYIDA